MKKVREYICRDFQEILEIGQTKNIFQFDTIPPFRL